MDNYASTNSYAEENWFAQGVLNTVENVSVGVRVNTIHKGTVYQAEDNYKQTSVVSSSITGTTLIADTTPAPLPPPQLPPVVIYVPTPPPEPPPEPPVPPVVPVVPDPPPPPPPAPLDCLTTAPTVNVYAACSLQWINPWCLVGRVYGPGGSGVLADGVSVPYSTISAAEAAAYGGYYDEDGNWYSNVQQISVDANGYTCQLETYDGGCKLRLDYNRFIGVEAGQCWYYLSYMYGDYVTYCGSGMYEPSSGRNDDKPWYRW
jgi:hypothetical protein